MNEAIFQPNFHPCLVIHLDHYIQGYMQKDVVSAKISQKKRVLDMPFSMKGGRTYGNLYWALNKDIDIFCYVPQKAEVS